MKFKAGNILISRRRYTPGKWLVLQVQGNCYSYLHLEGYIDIDSKEYSKIQNWIVVDTISSDNNYELIK